MAYAHLGKYEELDWTPGGLINMINSGVTAPCNLIPANWNFSHISPKKNAFFNEHDCFQSLICGQQWEPGLADLLGPGWSTLSRMQLLLQLQWIAAHPLFSAGGFLSSRTDPTGEQPTEQGQVAESTTLYWPPRQRRALRPPPSAALTLLRPG